MSLPAYLSDLAIRPPDSKTGAKDIPINQPALEELERTPRLQDNPYVIPGAKDGQHLVNLNKPWRRIRVKAGLPEVRIHDLRHSYASVAAAAGLGLPTEPASFYSRSTAVKFEQARARLRPGLGS